MNSDTLDFLVEEIVESKSKIRAKILIEDFNDFLTDEQHGQLCLVIFGLDE